jgi:hypothetical protein
MLKKAFSIVVFFFSILCTNAQESYFYPNSGKFNPAIPTPLAQDTKCLANTAIGL